MEDIVSDRPGPINDEPDRHTRALSAPFSQGCPCRVATLKQVALDVPTVDEGSTACLSLLKICSAVWRFLSISTPPFWAQILTQGLDPFSGGQVSLEGSDK